MKIIDASVSLEQNMDTNTIMKHLEKAGRVCYKSEGRISNSSSDKFIKNLLTKGHESVIEHYSVTFKVICDRGVTHEIVRHRIASYSQESTRFCNYSQDKFGNELTFIKPWFWNTEDHAFRVWEDTLKTIEQNYFKLLENGVSPQEARSILPNSLKSEIFITMNLREWRHFLKLRTSKTAHPQIREIAIMIYNILLEKLPIIFEDIVVDAF